MTSEQGPTADERPVTTGIPRPTTWGGRFLAAPIIAYRRWLSPAMPARCRFYPSCSAYALTALARHGALRGTGLAVRRLLRCHPFHPGGYDPVPEKDATGATQC
ncbi:membrane protein insertion efficiency factor YidD [Natronosporangium hydrolyticum]|uniref:Putative membrane protein insertion efficiency factor n=1 Tax=Natronosporangium hydrolyticum TaxID=2811111 RepID=A0A895YJN7_9ACTN|nr:membrane protein insertion efficiency factor YidD [Natronosporangium hydrolyticum]QSB14826.1 membrane protein insertion efficiency factor YidD [Natronosporangium hydrolyticum]